jgi:protocatechuate 3,4-dioxygenase beta subunit
LRRLAGASAVVALILAACGGGSGENDESAAAPRSEAAAKCRSTAEPTPAQAEGPYYKAGPPRRRSLIEPGVRGRRLRLRGRVLSPRCRPLARARVDFWQADGGGEYDNTGYRLRGWQRTDARGRYRLDTVVPAQYESRAPHIHVKVTPRSGRTLTTQLYLPGGRGNSEDPIFVRETLVRLRRGPGARRASFDFVVR